MVTCNLDNCKPLQNGIWELRIDHYPGYHIYYAQAGGKLLLPLTMAININNNLT